jgi:protein required for attachment to host cells
MANQTTRGGKKQGEEKQPGGKQHQGVRPGSSARKKERQQAAPRRSPLAAVPETSGVGSPLPPDGRSYALVAKGSEALLLSCGAAGWTRLRTFTHPESRLTGDELNAVSPSRQKAPAAGHRLAIERTNPHDYETERFARELADFLEASASRKEFDRLILFASPKFLGQVRNSLPVKLADRVVAAIPIDLTATNAAELPSRIDRELEASAEFRKNTATIRMPPSRQQRAEGARRASQMANTDGKLALRVHEILSSNPGLDATAMEVTVEAGEVTLHGQVATKVESELAVATARAVPNVAGVRNELVVREG